MGGRGASSGVGAGSDKKKFIDSIFDNKPAPSKPIDPAQFDNLKQAENDIQEKSIEHLIIFNNTGQTAEAAFSGDKHSVGVPADIELSGKTLTHNHPDSGWGGTLSLADMNLALKHDVASIRAVGRENEGVYALVKSKESQPTAFLNRLSKDINGLKNGISNTYSEAYAKYREAGHTKEQSSTHARQEAVGYLHKYYKQTAEQHGYTYTRQKRLIAESGGITQPASETNTPKQINKIKKGKFHALFVDKNYGADKEHSGQPKLTLKEKSGYIDGDIGYHKEIYGKYASWIATDLVTGKQVNTAYCNTLKEAKEDVIKNRKGIDIVRNSDKYQSAIENFNSLKKEIKAYENKR